MNNEPILILDRHFSYQGNYQKTYVYKLVKSTEEIDIKYKNIFEKDNYFKNRLQTGCYILIFAMDKTTNDYELINYPVLLTLEEVQDRIDHKIPIKFIPGTDYLEALKTVGMLEDYMSLVF